MKKALIVGINDYQNCPLSGCVNDAAEIARLLERNEDRSKNFEVILRENIQNRDELLGLIDSLYKGDSDISLFYFSGHGYINELGGYIVTPDYSTYNMGVYMDDILKYANMSRSKNKVIILDCCHAGAMGDNKNHSNTVSIVGSGVTILTSSRDDETSMEISGHGIFTNLLIEALKGGAANLQGKITPGSVYAYIDQALGAWGQRPMFKTNIYQFVSLRNVDPKITPSDMQVISECFPDVLHEMRLDPSYEFTNTYEVEHEVIEPFAEEDHTKIFKKLQKLESVGIIEPVGEEHMYFAAMHSKKCRLTPIGQYYWQLLYEGKI